MALKDLSTAEAADILVQLSPLMDNITTDRELMERVGKSIDKDGMTKVGIAIEAMHRVFSCVPLLLKDHRADVFGIVATVKRKTVAEIYSQPIVQTIKDIKEILADEDLLDFFDLFKSLGETA